MLTLRYEDIQDEITYSSDISLDDIPYVIIREHLRASASKILENVNMLENERLDKLERSSLLEIKLEYWL